MALAKKAGSSPREWGTLAVIVADSTGARFIPTRVGNTQHSFRLHRVRPVHPHASGEHVRNVQRERVEAGSSPREWGTRISQRVCRHPSRFIPTRVGNTCCIARATRPCTVHPHASGEHPGRITGCAKSAGSSPREWGTPPPRRQPRQRHRFIPTRVGNTVMCCSSTTGFSVHPHASGEHLSSCCRPPCAGGSSPREWGTRAGAFQYR